MKTIKLLSILFFSMLITTSCTSDEAEENVTGQTSSVPKNTLLTVDNSATLNHFGYSTFSLANGSLYDITVSEKVPTAQNLDYGSYIRIFVKEIPTSGTLTLSHRQQGDLDVANGEYYFNQAIIGTESWYAPFVNSRPTQELQITVDNGVTTFTIVDAELSDNYVAPITTTKKVSVSFSIPSDKLTGTPPIGFEPLAN